jgi:hypothetical protein
MNFPSGKWKELDVKASSVWNAGLTLLIDLPVGFSLQPALQYHQKGAGFNGEEIDNQGFIELPVSLQWGPDLLVFRPFVDVTPYIGYALPEKSEVEDLMSALSAKDRFEYGVGIGGGINVWKLQVIARYNWNFGSIYNWEGIKNHFPDLKEGIDNENFSGVTLGLSFLF